MKFVLDKRYRLRGWYKLPYGVYDTQKYEARFFDRHAYDLIMRCDAAHDIDVTALDEPKSAFLQDMLDNQPPHPRRHQSRLPHRSPTPDGHDMGCILPYHGKAWAKENNTWCNQGHYCFRTHYER